MKPLNKIDFLIAILSTFVFAFPMMAQPGKKVFHKAITNLSAKEFSAELDKTPKRTLLDVRSKEEFAEGHLPHALNINVFDDDFKARVGKLDKTTPIFVYCYAGGRSEEASDILADMGFARVINMTSGYRDWSKSGFPVEK